MRRVILLLALAACRGGGPATPRDAAPAPLTDDPWSSHAQTGRVRGLTAQEIAAVTPIFGSSIDYAKVRVTDETYGPIQPDGVMMTPRGTIYAPGDAWADDFFAPVVTTPAWAPPLVQSGLVHELVHVWQYENGVDLLKEGVEAFARTEGHYSDSYQYQLDASKDLLDFGIEQQAAIIEDWFLLTRWHVDATAYPMTAEQEAAWRPYYEAILKKFFANPLYAR